MSLQLLVLNRQVLATDYTVYALESLLLSQPPLRVMAVVKLSELRWGRVCAVVKLSQIGEQFGLAEEVFRHQS